MYCRKNKVSDVLAVLARIKEENKKLPYFQGITELRKQAVQEVAEVELSTSRYKNINSAYKTIHDACTRRLKPDIENIATFDRLTDLYLQQDSSKLKNILLRNSDNSSQVTMVNKFFG